MAFRGQRFDIDLSSDEDDDLGRSLSPKPHDASAPSLPTFVKDVTERPVASAIPPVAPTAKDTVNGFPAHKKRIPTSKFKQEIAANSTSPNRRDPASISASHVPQVQPGPAVLSGNERAEIDKENKARLASMSDEDIAKERQELMEGLSPSLIQRLLRRADIDDPQPADFPVPNASPSSAPSNTAKKVAFKIDDDHINQSPEPATDTTIAEHASTIPVPSTHFPRPPEPPELDPSSPNFLTELHEKYFPNLPHDPSKLAWMTPASSDTQPQQAAYDPSSHDIPIAALRFDFTGRLLAPSTAQSIPVSKGLHHHGDAPDAAGYTIGELARLARSQFPSQRCVAFQTLGRLLYRLGVGEFGRLERGFQGRRVAGWSDDHGSDDGDEEDEGEGLAKGLWDCVREGRVLETLEEEANAPGGHVSAKAYAVEALWLWRKGGGTEVRAT